MTTMIDNLTNWTVLSNEEMNHVKGGMGSEDPTLVAAEDPNAFMQALVTDPQGTMQWFEDFGYNHRQTWRFIRRFVRNYWSGC